MTERWTARKIEKAPKRNLRIGIDLDNTTFDLSQGSLRFINERFGTNFTQNDIRELKEYWYFQRLLEKLGVSKDEIQSLIEEAYLFGDKHRIYRSSPPFPGAIEVLKGIHRAGHQEFILTSRPPGLEKVTVRQFEELGIDWIRGVWPDGNILIRDEEYWEKMSDDEFKLHAIRGSFSYGRYQDFSGLDLHFDDKGSLITHPLSEGIRDKIFILNWGFNQVLVDGVPQGNLVPNWWVFYKLVRCRVRDENFDLIHISKKVRKLE